MLISEIDIVTNRSTSQMKHTPSFVTSPSGLLQTHYTTQEVTNSWRTRPEYPGFMKKYKCRAETKSVVVLRLITLIPFFQFFYMAMHFYKHNVCFSTQNIHRTEQNRYSQDARININIGILHFFYDIKYFYLIFEFLHESLIYYLIIMDIL